MLWLLSHSQISVSFSFNTKKKHKVNTNSKQEKPISITHLSNHTSKNEYVNENALKCRTLATYWIAIQQGMNACLGQTTLVAHNSHKILLDQNTHIWCKPLYEQLHFCHIPLLLRWQHWLSYYRGSLSMHPSLYVDYFYFILSCVSLRQTDAQMPSDWLSTFQNVQ